MLVKYPEAYATGMAIAKRAFVSSFRRNTTAVEKYYDIAFCGYCAGEAGVHTGFAIFTAIEHLRRLPMVLPRLKLEKYSQSFD
jgi:hypothetical protein